MPYRTWSIGCSCFLHLGISENNSTRNSLFPSESRLSHPIAVVPSILLSNLFLKDKALCEKLYSNQAIHELWQLFRADCPTGVVQSYSYKQLDLVFELCCEYLRSSSGDAWVLYFQYYYWSGSSSWRSLCAYQSTLSSLALLEGSLSHPQLRDSKREWLRAAQLHQACHIVSKHLSRQFQPRHCLLQRQMKNVHMFLSMTPFLYSNIFTCAVLQFLCKIVMWLMHEVLAETAYATRCYAWIYWCKFFTLSCCY